MRELLAASGAAESETTPRLSDWSGVPFEAQAEQADDAFAEELEL